MTDVKQIIRCLYQSPGGRAVLVLPFLFVLVSGPVCAQDASSADSTAWRPYQVGISTSALITIFDGPDAPENYQFYGRYRLTRHWTLRTAVRYEHQFADEQELNLTARTGVDYIIRDDGRLQLYAGLDAVGGYDRAFNDDKTYRLGAAPLFGMLIFVTDYLSFSVEPRLVALYSYFDNPTPSPDADQWTVGLKGDSLLIVSIHF
jgi:hypothetical protein